MTGGGGKCLRRPTRSRCTAAILVKALTGGRLEGTLHRAAGHGGDRCSVGFFLEPDFETAVVAPAGGPPVSYARHLVNVFPDRFEASRAA